MTNLPNGWFSDEDIKEYRRLASQVPMGGTIAELGVWMGRSLCSIADIIKERKLNVIAVDTFKGTKGEDAHKDIQNLRDTFEKNMKDFDLTRMVMVYEMTTNKAVNHVEDKSIDLCFIDARHDYEGVNEDINNWLPTVRGVIAGHDFSDNWKGVKKAVNEHFIPKVGGEVWSYNTKGILAYVSTLNRYDTTLPLTLVSIALQTYKPDHFVLFDDNENPRDLRQSEVYQYCFKLFNEKGISWEVIFGQKKGQHFNHETANTMGYPFAWRIDDDEIAEQDCLEGLVKEIKDGIGAVAGLVMQPNSQLQTNIQWYKWDGEPKEVDDLYSSFLYRTNVAHYDLRLSSVAHREETMFSSTLKDKGYKLIVTPKAVTWHFRSLGGIRSGQSAEMFDHDEAIYNETVAFQNSGKKLYVLNNGIGDHYMFRQVITPEKDAIIACCYPDVFPEYKCISIADAMNMVNIEDYNIYKWCGERNWKGHLQEAFIEMYKTL